MPFLRLSPFVLTAFVLALNVAGVVLVLVFTFSTTGVFLRSGTTWREDKLSLEAIDLSVINDENRWNVSA